MTGATRKHVLIVLNLVRTLDDQLSERPCHLYSNDLRVSVRDGDHYVYPDVIVTCGPETFEPDEFDSLVNPVVLIEVLSPSTAAYDRGDKFLLYQTIPSLREYVLVSQESRRIEVFRRQPDGSWLYQSCPPSAPPLALESIGCTLTLDEVYRKVEPPGA
jgi:Uma2 family endonuclease